jgi:hypothetical protein
MRIFVQMMQVLGPLKSIISPHLQHIKLDKKKAEVFPELLTKVLKRNSRSTNFMLFFFKKLPIEDCDWKACSDCIFKVLRMPP